MAEETCLKVQVNVSEMTMGIIYFIHNYVLSY